VADLRKEHGHLAETRGECRGEGRRGQPPSDLRTHGNRHVAFRVDNLDHFIAEMTAKGIEIPFVVREEFGTGCFLRDGTGNLIQFVEEAET
jgi:methylmalonyl-CoA/ethylmalonyl-CoA epimerase